MRKFPVGKSKVIAGWEWTGKRIGYGEQQIRGDTFPMTWAEDDIIYTSAGDPIWCGDDDGLDTEKFVGGPLDYKIIRTSNMRDYVGWGGWGQKPTGMICVQGILYLAVQNMMGFKPPAHGGKSQHGSDVAIIHSIDKGQNWRPKMSEMNSWPSKGVMFPGCKFGGPSFVQFGQNNQGAVDNFVYAVSSDQWDNGSEMRLGRVPSDKILHANAWQWVSGFDKAGKPKWTGNLDDSSPVLVDERFISVPEMVYLPKIKRYLLATWRLRVDFANTDGTDLMIYESPNPWGPFSVVHFEECWAGKETNPYCPRIPLKWMNPDGISGYMQYSGSWAAPQTMYYRSNVQAFRLKMG
jgi:hypothetical protein